MQSSGKLWGTGAVLVSSEKSAKLLGALGKLWRALESSLGSLGDLQKWPPGERSSHAMVDFGMVPELVHGFAQIRCRGGVPLKNNKEFKIPQHAW